jgi:myo-inositol-1(or 4)-monophosphatase
VTFLREADRTLTHFDGSPFKLDSREALASNGLLHAEMEFLFAQMFAGEELSPIPTPVEFRALYEA